MNSQNLPNIYQRINKVQKEVKTVFKGVSVSTGQNSRSYRAVSHDDVASLLHDPMANNGIVASVNITNVKLTPIDSQKEYNGKIEIRTTYMAEVWVSVDFVNSDLPSDRFTVNGYAYSFDPSDKATGKALSYAVKNVYLKNFNLESTDDEEARNLDFEAPKPSPSSAYQRQERSNPSFSLSPSPSDAPASPAQIALVKRLAPDVDTTGLTKSNASKLIEQINKGSK